MQPAADFDRVARIYRGCEYLALGRTLERVRTAQLPALCNAERVLVLGDGDGRFLAQLLHANPLARVVAVDASAAMLHLARGRVRAIGAENRVEFVHGDIRQFQPPGEFDAITTHFLLDCFSTEELDAFLPRLVCCLASGGAWVHSDFRLPDTVLRPLAWGYVSSLYLAFALLAGLRTRSLPDDAAALARAGVVLVTQQRRLGGLLVSELWRKPSDKNQEQK